MGRLTHRTGDGWTYFVTTNAFQSTSLFQVEESAQIIVRKMLEYRDKGHYVLHEFVLMPNHLHLILTPGESVSLEKAMQLIKGGSSHEIHKVRGARLEIWQAGFHESRVTSWADYQKKRDYIWCNPVAAKLVDRPEAWVYGSAGGKYKLDPIPQGLKPIGECADSVGAKARIPGAATKIGEETPVPQGLKPPSVRASDDVGAKAPTPGASTRISNGVEPTARVAAVEKGKK